MSGITGIIKEEISKDILPKMLDKISYRGKFGTNISGINNAAFGYCSSNKKIFQPSTTTDKKIIAVFDGEIDNVDDLKAELENKNIKNDIDVITYGFQKWHYDLASKIEGTFALVIYDSENDEVYCARDGWGSKTLYYYATEREFVFASEAKAILEYPDYNKKFNEEILASYLCFNSVPTEETFFKGIYRMMPGEYLVYKTGNLTKNKFFKLKFKKTNESFEKLVEDIENSVKKSVEINSKEEKSLGSFLSSGIDSSYLVSILKPKHTFTIGYEEQRYDEITYAKDLSEKLGIENHSVIVSKEEYLKDYDQLQYYMDEPLANPSLAPINILTKEASKYVDTVFSGEGADELFGGYNSYQEEITQSWYMKIPYFVRHLASLVSGLFPDVRGLNFVYRRGRKLKDYHIGLGRVFRDEEALRIVKNKNQIKPTSVVQDVYNYYQNSSTLEQRQAIDYYFWLVNDFGFIVDRCGAINGLKGKTPYLNKTVYDVAMKLPLSAKINNETTKVALRTAASHTIPNESYKKKKLGFPVPLREWIKDDIYYSTIKEKFNSGSAEKFFNKTKILDLLNSSKTDNGVAYKKVWTIYTFLVWYDVYFGKDNI